MLTFNVAGAKNKIIFVDETNKSLQKQLKESIEKGTDGVCDLVVPHTFDITKIRNNEIVVEDVIIHDGRSQY